MILVQKITQMKVLPDVLIVIQLSMSSYILAAKTSNPVNSWTAGSIGKQFRIGRTNRTKNNKQRATVALAAGWEF